MTDKNNGVMAILQALVTAKAIQPGGRPPKAPPGAEARREYALAAVAELLAAAEKVDAMSIQSDAHKELRASIRAMRGES